MWRKWFYHFQSIAGLTEKECKAFMLLSLLFLIGAVARYIDNKQYMYGDDYYKPLLQEFERRVARADSFQALLTSSSQDTLKHSSSATDVIQSSTPVAARPILSGNGNQINLNTATVHELESLPGIGPALAARILLLRERLGRFSDPGDLIMVPGIGAKKMAQIEALLTVETAPLQNQPPNSDALKPDSVKT